MDETETEDAEDIEPLAPKERLGLLIFGVIALVCVIVAATLVVLSLTDKSTSAAPVGISGTPGTWAAGPNAPGRTDGFILMAGSQVIAGPKGPAGLNPWTVYVYDIVKHTWKTYAGPPGIADQTPYARVWDGTEMLVFGGFIKHTSGHPNTVFNTSAASWAFNPSTGEWRALAAMPTAPNRELDAAWTGQVAVVFAGGDGGHPATFEFNPATNTWSPGYAALPGGIRIEPSVDWTGHEVLAWGGVSDSKAAIGDPRAPRWTKPLATSLADGYAYSPATHKWTQIAAAPVSAVDSATVWTGTDWMVYGGTQITAGVQTPIPGGYSYDPGTDTWVTLPAAPFKGLSGPVAVWNGDTFVVWGRDTAARRAAQGGVFDPVATAWSAMDASSQVAGVGSVATWTGKSMLVVGAGHVAEWKPSS